MNADVPLVDSQIIKELYDRHCASNAAISFVTAHNTDPSSRYGRVIEEDGRLAIIEANEFEGDYTQHCCINAGIYIAQREFLTTTLATLQETNQEIYITDLIKKASEKNLTVTTLKAPYDTVRGVNTYEELWAVEQIKRSHLIKYWMQKGVRFFAAQNVHIDLNVTIGAGTFIGAGTHLLGATKIGKNSTVDAFSYLRNAQIDDNVMIKTYCMIEDSSIKSNASVGPFAHVGPNATIGTESFIGNFVEIKNSTMGIQSKAKHLSYLGNAVIENNVNIGAGSITCNYDGSSKHMTTIKNDAFIGTNTSLIAPVTVGTGAYTAAGSTITDDVPDHALAIARSRQINKKEYAHIIRAKQEDRDAQTASNEAAHTNNQEKSFVGAVKTNNDITLFEE
jgi:bifunctional UDP-N-acetylglucosamine pyrophosphorylase/glucosamine-1-phosphate N-acetyltransferase